MRTPHAFWIALFAVSWLGCSTVSRLPIQQTWDEAALECDDPQSDQCVTLLCLDDACGFYRCENTPGEIELARFPPSRPPVAAAAPGSGPRRNWGGAQNLPRGAVMTFPNWNGAPARVIPFTPAHARTMGEAPHLSTGAEASRVVRRPGHQDPQLHHAHSARASSTNSQCGWARRTVE